MKRRLILSLAVVAGAALVSLPFMWDVKEVSGVVRTPDGRPLSGAIVRVKTTNVASHTGDDGRFSLTGFAPASRIRVTAWRDGFYVDGSDAWPWKPDVLITLMPYTVPDNPDYAWVAPAVETRSEGEEWLTQAALGLAARLSFNRALLPLAAKFTLGCRDCHGKTIYEQWAVSAHALGGRNPRFMSMFNGTDVHGKRSPLTGYGYNREYGPGYKLDFPFPEMEGNCATCHTPGAALANAYGTDPNTVTGVNAQGSHCDFCHKIADVSLDSKTGRPFENMTGILSIELMRPSPEPQLFFGPYDDVDVGPDTFLPLMKQSEFCAPCHNASFWGVPIYQSFGEWLESPYSDPETGQTCQDCHMKPDGVTTNFAPGRGGLERDAATIPTHYFPGANDEALLQDTVTMRVAATQEEDRLLVTVRLTNHGAGHHVPTDSPLRQMILVVRATDSGGDALPLLDGPTLPEWTGVGKSEDGYLAGLPGRAYAKVLEERWTEISPTGAYWNPTRVVSDNRISALRSDTTRYTFASMQDEIARVDVRVLFRRAFKELMDQKGWEMEDILMAQQSLTVAGGD